MSTAFLSLEVKALAIRERSPQALTGPKHKNLREPTPLAEQKSNLGHKTNQFRRVLARLFQVFIFLGAL